MSHLEYVHWTDYTYYLQNIKGPFITDTWILNAPFGKNFKVPILK